MAMAPVDVPYCAIYRSRGRTFAYYRREGRRIRIKAEPGHPAFPAAYEAARRQWEAERAAPVHRAAPGSLSALIAEYHAAPEYRGLRPQTRRDYDRVLDIVETRFGDLPTASASRAWVYRLRDEVQDRPRTANYRVAVISRLMAFAVDRGHRPDNPALRLGQLATGQGHRVWSDAETAAMTGPEAGDVALPVLLALHTAQRLGDVLRLLWSAYDGSAIRLRQGKTGAELVIHAGAELRAVLDTIPRRGAVICLTASGRPWARFHFVHRFATTRERLGLPADLHFHGLRHTAATRLAEAGASDAEIQAVTGHKTRAMVARYTRQAQQRGLARTAVSRLPGNARGTGSV